MVGVIGRMNRVALASRDKADVSRRGKVNDTGKRTADRYLEKNDLESWCHLQQLEPEILTVCF